MVPVECLCGLGAAGIGGLGTYAVLRLRGWKNRAEVTTQVEELTSRRDYLDYNEVVDIRRNLGKYLRTPGVLRRGNPEE